MHKKHGPIISGKMARLADLLRRSLQKAVISVGVYGLSLNAVVDMPTIPSATAGPVRIV